MRIIDHRLDGVKFDHAREIGDTIDPKFIVNHYTAGYTAQSAIQTFKTTIIAAHLVIDRDGTVTQMVPFNKKANHAGPSEWAGVKMLNGHSIGVEFVNIGWAKMRNDGRLVDAYGRILPQSEADSYIEAPNPRVGSGRIFWQPYTEEQIAIGIEIEKAIIATYTIRDIVSHEEIDTRHWKTDPGPAFPMNRFTSLLRGVETVKSDQPLNGMVGVVNTATLNIRGGADTSFPVIGISQKGSRLGIIEFSGGWYRVHTVTKDASGKPVEGSGWVSSQFVDVR
jgi:N-acetylmuramoyl-L-alanine amidase